MEQKQNKKYGEFGGQYVAESLMNTLKELEKAYREAIKDPSFWEEYNYYMKDYVGRENPLYFAVNARNSMYSVWKCLAQRWYP